MIDRGAGRHEQPRRRQDAECIDQHRHLPQRGPETNARATQTVRTFVSGVTASA